MTPSEQTGGPDATLAAVVAWINAERGTTYALRERLPGDEAPRIDDALLDQILESIQISPEVVRPERPPPAEAVALDRELIDQLVVHEVPSDVTRIVDDTHGLAIAVPPDFTETNTFNEFNDDGSPRPMVVAAPNLTEFLIDGEMGVLVTRLPLVDPATLLRNTAYSFCADGGSGTISNGAYKGVVRMSDDCAGPIDRIASIALVPGDRSSTVFLSVALPDDDLTALQIAIASVELLEPRSGTVPAH
jgi:hypothetical protein